MRISESFVIREIAGTYVIVPVISAAGGYDDKKTDGICVQRV